MTERKRTLIHRVKSAKKLVYIFIFLEICAYSQEGYRYEFGAGGGLSTYTGDVSRNMLAPPSAEGSLFFRYNKTQRWAYNIEYNKGKTRGDSKDLNIMLPDGAIAERSFINDYHSLDLTIEGSFFPYPKQKKVENSSDITPYYFVGLGVKRYTTQAVVGNIMNHSSYVIAVPLGVGIKWKLANNWGLQYQMKIEKLMSDKFDGINNPYSFDQAITIHRQDFLYLNTVSLYYSFGAIKWDCNCNKKTRRKKDKNPF